MKKIKKNFFAFLDELDHLEAKKENKWNDGKWHLDQTPPRMTEIPSFLIFFCSEPSLTLLWPQNTVGQRSVPDDLVF